jgi:hypothetical protein
MAVTAIKSDENTPPEQSICWCCNRGPDQVAGFVRLKCHAEVAVCFHCLDWLVDSRRQQVRQLTQWGRRSLWQRVRDVYPGKRCR